MSLGSQHQQELDAQVLFKDVEVYVGQGTVPGRVRTLVDRAVRIAHTRRGVSVISLPKDLLEMTYEDEEGRIWSSAGDDVHYIAPDGRKLGRIKVPYTVSNLEFGGRGRARLFIGASHTLFAIYTNTRGLARLPLPGSSPSDREHG